jgi:CRISPR-associated protein Cas1
MATLYLIEQNSVLRKTSDRLILCKRPEHARKSPGVRIEDIILELPCEDIDQVMLFGNVQVTTQALQQLLEHGIELAIFTLTGQLLGQLTPPKTKNIHLRIAQFERYHQPEFAVGFARKVVAAKIKNALFILRQHRKNHPQAFSDADFTKFDQTVAKAEQAGTLETLRGLEGAATAAYFHLFGQMLNSPWKFGGRSRRPPQDPPNAVLSFGYVIVGAELQSVLDGVGFDPYLGFYHQLDYGRPSLALDLLEEFRHSLVDRLTLNLFNMNILSSDDFFNPPRGGVYLNISGKRKFFQHYERILGEYLPSVGIEPKPKAFRAIFQQQVQALAKVVQGEADYQPFQLK